MSALAITCQKVTKGLDESVLAAGLNMPNIGHHENMQLFTNFQILHSLPVNYTKRL